MQLLVLTETHVESVRFVVAAAAPYLLALEVSLVGVGDVGRQI